MRALGVLRPASPALAARAVPEDDPARRDRFWSPGAKEDDAMQASEEVLDLAATDMSEESWEQIVADMANDDPDIRYVLQSPTAWVCTTPLCQCNCTTCGSACCI
jgi:hypothetical protein